MNQIVDQMKSYKEYEELWSHLPDDIEANLRFARLVMQEERINTEFFFGDYSNPIIRGIAISFYGGNTIESVVPYIISEYFLFVANPFVHGKKQWYQLATYRGENGKKLRGWLTNNFHQYFSRLLGNEIKRGKMLEYVDYETLIKVMDNKNVEPDYDDKCFDDLKYAWNAIKEKYKHVLTVLIKETAHWSDAWEELNVYLNPKGGREVMDSWSNKKKQDALASLKARALEHLILEFNKRITNE